MLFEHHLLSQDGRAFAQMSPTVPSLWRRHSQLSYNQDPLSGETIYKSLMHDDSIRLLIVEPGFGQNAVRCCLEHTRLGLSRLRRKAKYEALSYAWGPGPPLHNISINNVEFKVRANLYHALLELRLNRHRRTLWIDAICLNQEDVPERNHQVKIMRRIYERATNTIIWLGRASHFDELTLVELTLCDIPSRISEAEKIRMMTTTVSSPSFEAILSKSWFKRVWVQQEFAVSGSTKFMCGHYSFTPVTLHHAITATWEILRETSVQFHNKTMVADDFLSLRNFYQRGESLCLSQHLYNTFGRLEASDPRDHIFSLLGLLDDRDCDQVIVDYDLPVEHSFSQAMQYMLNGKNSHWAFQLLSLVGSLSLSERYRDCLPSWVPDFACRAPFKKAFENISIFSASASSKAQLSVANGTLTIVGKILDTIKTIHQGLFPEHVNDGDLRKWFQECRSIAERDGSFYKEHEFENMWWTLLVCDVYLDPAVPSPYKRAKDGYGELFLHLDLLAQPCFTEKLPQSTSAALLEAQTAYVHSMRVTSFQSSFFSTKKGLLGWNFSRVKEGDKVCVLSGAQTPFIIRERHDGFYELVGNAYTHGIMYGEAMEWEGVELEEIRIC